MKTSVKWLALAGLAICLGGGMVNDARAVVTTVLSEGFEAAFPGGWSVGDSNVSGTPAYWDDYLWVTGGRTPRSGYWMGYCAGIGHAGTAAAPIYQSSMTAFLKRNIDLTGATVAWLTFYQWIPAIDANWDYCRVYLGATKIYEVTEANAGWTMIRLNLSPYVGAIHELKFEFVSDSVVQSEGWYIDDILVQKGDRATDLVISGVSVSRSSNAARTFSASTFSLHNDYGTDLPSGSLRLEAFLSSDTTLNEGQDQDPKIGEFTFTWSLASGETDVIPVATDTHLVQMTQNWTPFLVDSGTYYVFTKITSLSAVETWPSDNRARTSSTITYTSWDVGYTSIGGGWRRLGWFGDYSPMGTTGWIWHNKHGFFYVAAGSTATSAWLYSQDMGWLWTGNGTYPFLYRSSPAAWLWYNGATGPRWFRNLTTGLWESRP